MEDLVPIGEFSGRTGLSPKRLRDYAASGLLVPAAVDPSSGYRYYAPGQVAQAKLIDALRAAGVPLADIVELVRAPSAESFDRWSRRLQIEAVRRQEALNVARELLHAEGFAFLQDDKPSGSTPMTHLQSAVRCELGHVRENNEDRVVANSCLAVVADGMGGHPGGEVASAVAVSLVQAAFTGRSLDELQAAVRAANRAIWDRATADRELEGMGTTVCAVGLTEDGDIAVVHVGDSRAYAMQDGALRQITDDHSLTADLVRRGELSDSAARAHPQRGVITRVLGGGPDVEPDGNAHHASVGDRMLLCSDGLFNELTEDEIAAIMIESKDLQVTADELAGLALSRGARDNVSVVVVELCA